MRHVLVVAALAAATMLPTTAATAACPAPDSADSSPLMAPTRTAGTVSMTGGGWGHGIGMSQYALRGGADLGCSRAELLAGSFPTTTVQQRSNLPVMRVGLLVNGATEVSRSRLTNTGDKPVNWFHRGTKIHAQRPGRLVRLRMNGQSRLVMHERRNGSWVRVWRQSTTERDVITARLRPSGHRWGPRQLQIAGKTARGETITYNRGQLKVLVGHRKSTTFEQVIRVPIQGYLMGLNEMPYSWPRAALGAQAIAGRSYAAATVRARGGNASGCTCNIFDSVRDQVYTAGLEEVTSPTAFARWKRAVINSSRQVVVTSSGAIATTFYSSSSGGGTQSLSEGWGSSDRAYLPAQNLARWEEAAAAGNSRHRWRRDRNAGAVAGEFGLEVLDRIRVSERTASGRADTVRVAGWQADGDRKVTRLTTDSAIRSRLDVWSNNLRTRWNWPNRARFAGPNRYATAAAVSRRGWRSGATTVVLARGDVPVGALAGVGAAGARDAPLLLTARDHLSGAARREVNRLGATRAVLIGGPGALSDDVREDLLRNTGVDTVRRLHGGNRFETLAAVARDTGVGGHGTAFVARATRVSPTNGGWAGGVAISGVVASRARADRPSPLLGVGADGIPRATRRAIRDLGITRINVVGGPGVVSPEQVSALEDMGVTVRRWAGSNRYTTSMKIARRVPGSGRPLVIASGKKFPGGLTAGAFVARRRGTLLLVPDGFDTSRSPWRSWQLPALLEDLSTRHDRTVVIGGTGVVAPREFRAVAWYLTPGAGASASSMTSSSATVSSSETDGQAEVGSNQELVAPG